MPEAPSALFSPLRVGPITLRNRFIKAATNEGMAKRGQVTKGLALFHERIAEGGAALSTLAYCATSPDGRTFPDQVSMNDDAVTDLRVLTAGVHRHGAAACAQLTHAGCFTYLPPALMRDPVPLSSSGGFNKVGVLSGRWMKKAMSTEDMTRMTDEFVRAAQLARESGFDAVELHMGHGYLLSQFVSRLYNHRRDAYGGPIARRMRFPNEVLAKVLDAVGKDMAVIVKFSMTDAAPGGNRIEDGLEIARTIERAGAHMAVLSNGMNVESVTAMFGAPLPTPDYSKIQNKIVALGLRWQKLTAPKLGPFRESYLRENALAIRKAVAMPLAYIGGVQSRAAAEQALADGFEAIALGRALVHDPAFVRKLESGAVAKSGCTACNQCVTMMYSPGGTACVMGKGMDPKLNKIRAGAME